MFNVLCFVSNVPFWLCVYLFPQLSWSSHLSLYLFPYITSNVYLILCWNFQYFYSSGFPIGPVPWSYTPLSFYVPTNLDMWNPCLYAHAQQSAVWIEKNEDTKERDTRKIYKATVRCRYKFIYDNRSQWNKETSEYRLVLNVLKIIVHELKSSTNFSCKSLQNKNRNTDKS